MNIRKNKEKLQSLIGFINWYRSFLPNLSTKLRNITEKLKNKKIIWSEEDKKLLSNIFEEIKICTTLSFSKINSPYELYIDASYYAIGSILQQNNKIIGIYSMKLNSSQKTTQ
ncbi:Transposon Ty3-I Gag-Pol polyprotein [Dictyocoela muelleri]|nr:Transposon Ty3-I Gag-Pol polyprotein [Dictyocoela muelleri]